MLQLLAPEWLVLGVKQPLATQPQWLLLGKADSSKVVNLTNMSGCFRPEAATEFERYNGPTLLALVFLDQRQPARMVANGVELGIGRQPLNRPSDRRCEMFIQ